MCRGYRLISDGPTPKFVILVLDNMPKQRCYALRCLTIPLLASNSYLLVSGRTLCVCVISNIMGREVLCQFVLHDPIMDHAK